MQTSLKLPGIVCSNPELSHKTTLEISLEKAVKRPIKYGTFNSEKSKCFTSGINNLTNYKKFNGCTSYKYLKIILQIIRKLNRGTVVKYLSLYYVP